MAFQSFALSQVSVLFGTFRIATTPKNIVTCPTFNEGTVCGLECEQPNSSGSVEGQEPQTGSKIFAINEKNGCTIG
jgi:hypothetical protein